MNNEMNIEFSHETTFASSDKTMRKFMARVAGLRLTIREDGVILGTPMGTYDKQLERLGFIKGEPKDRSKGGCYYIAYKWSVPNFVAPELGTIKDGPIY